MQWPGYPTYDWKRQFQAKDETASKNPITLERLVRHVGRSVDAFIRVRSSSILSSSFLIIATNIRMPVGTIVRLRNGDLGRGDSRATTSPSLASYTYRRAASCRSSRSIDPSSILHCPNNSKSHDARCPDSPQTLPVRFGILIIPTCFLVSFRTTSAVSCI